MITAETLATAIPGWPRPAGGELGALAEVLESGAWGSAAGHVVKRFEADFAAYQGARYGIACGNGTLALVAALAALDLPQGSEVIVPSYTFFATAAAPALLGLVPVFCDTTADSHLMDPKRLEQLIGPRTSAIVPVHLAGVPCDMDAILAVANRHGLPVVEDAAQAAGARYRGRSLPVGAIATFSFQSSKNLAAGEGGIMLTNDAELADQLYSYVNVGRVRGGGWYEHQSFGLNLRLSEFHGAVLASQLAELPALQDRRAAGAEYLHDRLAGLDGLELPPVRFADGTVHGQHLFLMRFPSLGAQRRDALLARLQDGGLAHASAGYVPLHRNLALLEKARRNAEAVGSPFADPECRQTDARCAETIWLPQSVLLLDPPLLDAVADLVRDSLRTELEAS